MFVRRDQPSPRELFVRASAARGIAQAVRLEARETVARCAESRLALDAARRGRDERASN